MTTLNGYTFATNEILFDRTFANDNNLKVVKSTYEDDSDLEMYCVDHNDKLLAVIHRKTLCDTIGDILEIIYKENSAMILFQLKQGNKEKEKKYTALNKIVLDLLRQDDIRTSMAYIKDF